MGGKNYSCSGVQAPLNRERAMDKHQGAVTQSLPQEMNRPAQMHLRKDLKGTVLRSHTCNLTEKTGDGY